MASPRSHELEAEWTLIGRVNDSRTLCARVVDRVRIVDMLKCRGFHIMREVPTLSSPCEDSSEFVVLSILVQFLSFMDTSFHRLRVSGHCFKMSAFFVDFHRSPRRFHGTKQNSESRELLLM
jgi:hypothetical protein